MIHIILTMIKQVGVCVDPAAINEPFQDIKDLPFYEVVMEKRQERAYLVTARELLTILENNL